MTEVPTSDDGEGTSRSRSRREPRTTPLPRSFFSVKYLVLATILVIACSGVWSLYANNPESRATEQMQSARDDMQDGEYEEAAKKLSAVATGSTSRAPEARKAFREILSSKLNDLPRAQAAAVVALAVEGTQSAVALAEDETVIQAAISLAEKHAGTDAKFAVSTLTKVALLAGDHEQFALARTRLFETAARENPSDPDIASAFAVLLESEEKYDECRKILAPIADELGTREGARVLGLICARDGDFDGARRLLTPYCTQRLGELRTVEAKVNSLSDSIYKSTIDDLKNGKGPEDWYQRYDAADEAGQNQMVQAFVREAFEKDSAYTAARADLQRHAPIVSVALSLGGVMLRRAQSMSSEERKSELKAAEDVFVSIRGTAGQSDEYRLYYGQVLYWLGKAAEGKKLFDEFLAEAANEGRSRRMVVVAQALRSVGAESDARTLAEQAYKAATSAAERHGAASVRALFQADIDDEIKWLERSDLSNPHQKAGLATARGRRAARVGDEAEAAKHYREAVQLYGTLPRGSATLNNSALAYQALFAAVGDPDDLRKAASMMEEALKLNPGDGILLNNVAQSLEMVRTLDLLDGRVDFGDLRTTPDTDMLDHLYQDSSGWSAIQTKLSAMTSFRESIDHLEQCVLLSPKSTRPYTELVDLYEWIQDAKKLRALRATTERVDLDIANDRQARMDYYSGKNDARNREWTMKSIERYEKTLAVSGASTTTRSILIGYALRAESGAAPLGLTSRLDGLLDMAEALYSKHPSAGLRTSLISGHLWRASRALCASHPSYERARQRSMRTLSADYTLLFAAERDEELRAVAAAHPDVRRAVALVEEGMRLLPQQSSAWRWAILNQFKPSAATAMRTLLENDEVRRIETEINWRVAPYHAAAALGQYWLHVIAGEATKAEAVLKEVESHGTTLPRVPGSGR